MFTRSLNIARHECEFSGELESKTGGEKSESSVLILRDAVRLFSSCCSYSGEDTPVAVRVNELKMS